MWVNFFDKIYVINLAKREDRLLQITEDFEKYSIPFLRVEAIYHPQGAEGLKETMLLIFNEAIERGYKNILIFEDDCLMVVDETTFNLTMDKVVVQLPEDYQICLLGCQLTHRISHFHSENLIPVLSAFSTHASAYSIAGIRAIMASGLQAPIDNHIVAVIQPLGKTYCTFPLLCSQYEGFSDIGQNVHSWRPFIEARFEQKIIEFKQGMR